MAEKQQPCTQEVCMGHLPFAGLGRTTSDGRKASCSLLLSPLASLICYIGVAYLHNAPLSSYFSLFGLVFSFPTLSVKAAGVVIE